jgi:hypothetical protein
MIEQFLIATVSGIGMATLMVEKGDDFPVKLIRDPVRAIVRFIAGESWASIFNCTVCMSFWTTLLCELFMYFAMHKGFTWPLSGFAASGITFYTIDFLNTLETRKAYDGTRKEEETQD